MNSSSTLSNSIRWSAPETKYVYAHVDSVAPRHVTKKCNDWFCVHLFSLGRYHRNSIKVKLGSSRLGTVPILLPILPSKWCDKNRRASKPDSSLPVKENIVYKQIYVEVEKGSHLWKCAKCPTRIGSVWHTIS